MDINALLDQRNQTLRDAVLARLRQSQSPASGAAAPDFTSRNAVDQFGNAVVAPEPTAQDEILDQAKTLGRRFLFGPTNEEMGLPADMNVQGPQPAMIPGVQRGFDALANLIDPPAGEGGYGRGFLAGALQGLGGYVAGEADVLQAAVPPGGPKGLTAGADALAEIKTLFPRLDAYTKPTLPLSRATILKRVAAATNLSDEAKTVLTQLADQVGDRRVMAGELHALAAGETYTPERVLRKPKPIPEGKKQIPGAPLGVWNARQERALRDNYLRQVEEGVAGKPWYEDSGKAIFFHANDDPTRAMQVAGDLSATSSSTSVSANSGMGIKGYNQATAGVPIEAGRYPTAMSKRIADIHDPSGEGLQGLKQDAFANNMAEGGGFLPPAKTGEDPRLVHDIWDAEARGYVLPTGEPMRQGFTPVQHRYMDAQDAKLIEEANRRKLGGFDDWNHLGTQASAWTGAQIRADKMDPADAAKSFKDFFPLHYAQGSRETIPGRSTAHMPELHQSGMEKLREQLHERIMRESGIYDEQLRDQITAGYGGLIGRSFDGPGLYQGAAAPGRQTQVLTGSVEVPGSKGARVLDDGSRRILDASEATHGLLTAQDAGAYSRVLPAGSGQARNAWDVTLPGGMITPAQMQALAQRLGPGVSNMVLVPTPDGIRLAFMDEATMKGAVKMLGGKVKTAGTLQGNLITNDWQTQRAGQGYLDPIRTMKGGPEKFDVFAPAMAARLRDIDRRFARDTGGRFTLSPVIDEVRAAIASDGFAGLERLAKKYAIPVTALAAALAELRLDDPSQATAAAGPASGDKQ